MIRLRSALFLVLGLLWTALLALIYIPLPLMSRKGAQGVGKLWCRGLIWLVRVCCGLRWRVVGRENLPTGPAIIAAKHQSAWDTLIFHLLVSDPIYVLKRELLLVPLVGWYLKKAGNIAIDRGAGFRSIKTMLPAVDRALAEGSQVIVFPEGTRTAPGQRRTYQPGVAALYARAKVPVIPVALNSGVFWGRRRMLKLPGLITLQVLPPMPRDMQRAAFLSELERRIEGASERLCRSALAEQNANIDGGQASP